METKIEHWVCIQEYDIDKQNEWYWVEFPKLGVIYTMRQVFMSPCGSGKNVCWLNEIHNKPELVGGVLQHTDVRLEPFWLLSAFKLLKSIKFDIDLNVKLTEDV